MRDREIQSTMPALETFATVTDLKRFAEDHPEIWFTLSAAERNYAKAKVTLISEGYRYESTTDSWIGPQLQDAQIIMVGDSANIVERKSPHA